MKRVFFAVVLVSIFSTQAFAAGQERGVYLVGELGKSTNISNVNSTTSLSGLIGYRFNSVLSVEGGMDLLAEKASYIIPPVGYTGVGSTYTSTSISGAEAAAKLSLPLRDWFSVFARFGYASLSRSNSPSPAEVEVSWKGSTYGVGAQITLPHEFSVNGSRMKIGFRAGVNKYNLKDATGLLTETPTNTYVAGVILF
jgi:opacity protein-like surface antigen